MQKEISIAPGSYTILSCDLPLLESDFFLQSKPGLEFLFGLSLGVFRAADESNPQRYVNNN